MSLGLSGVLGTRSALVALLVVVATLAFSACGGDSTPGETSADTAKLALAGGGDSTGASTDTESRGTTKSGETPASEDVPGTTLTGDYRAKAQDGGNKILVAALGDSITAGDPNFDPDTNNAYGFGSDPQSQYEFWAAAADQHIEFRNCGVFGERTEEIATRLEACAKDAEVLVIQGGINDIAQSLQGNQVVRTEAVKAAAQNIEAMIEHGKKLGLDIAVTDVLPWNNAHPYATPYIDMLNEKITEIAQRQKVPLIPFHDVIEDPANPGLMADPWTADGDHPSVEGYKRMGELAFELPPNQR